MVITSICHNKKLSNLAKIYTNNAKYSGSNDNFRFKLAISHEIYLKTDILLKAKIKTFPTMLKGLTLDHYYLNISNSTVTMNFDQVYNYIRNYFERVKFK